MALAEGHNVGILVGVVVAVRNLTECDITVVYLSCLKSCIIGVCLEFGENFCYSIAVILRSNDLVGSECGMSVVTSCIKNGNHGTFTGILYATAVEDTGVVNLNGVLYRSRRKISVREDYSLYAIEVTYSLDLLVGGADECGIHDIGVCMLDPIDKSCLLKRGKNAGLIFFHRLYDLACTVCVTVLCKG